MADSPWIAPWIAPGHLLADGTRAGRLLHAGEHWQILAGTDGERLLLAVPELAERWAADGLLTAAQLPCVRLDGIGDVALLKGGEELTLALVSACERPLRMADALSFAAGLRATRGLLPTVSLADAVFCERYSRLLPVQAAGETSSAASGPQSDLLLLGAFLTGGARVPADDVRAVHRMTGWMGTNEIRAVLEAAGISDAPSPSGGVLTRPRRRQAGEHADEGGQPEARDMQTRTGDDVAEKGPFRLPGRPALQRFFSEHVIDVVAHPERYGRFGIGFPGAVVLHGPPGSGKTFAVQRLVEHLGWPLLSVDSGSVGSPYIHETSRRLAELFDEAASLAPSVVVFDEMEAFVADRHAHQAGGLHHVEETAQLLQRIPQAVADRVLVVGMTNHLDMIDPAMLRRGRFDHIIEVGMPQLEEVTELLDALLAACPVEPSLNRPALAAGLAGRPLSDAAFVVRDAARVAAGAGRERIGQSDLDAALAGLPAAADSGARPIGFVWD